MAIIICFHKIFVASYLLEVLSYINMCTINVDATDQSMQASTAQIQMTVGTTDRK